MASRIPPLLDPYVQLPPETSLILLTSVLGASTNWLIQRYLCSFLSSSNRNAGWDSDQGKAVAQDDVNVVLVSFLRDYAFWKEGAGRTGVDLDALMKKSRFVFIDGLNGLFTPNGPSIPNAGAGRRMLSSATLPDFQKELNEAVSGLQAQHPDSKIVLLLDSPDFLLASSGNNVLGLGLQDALLDIREKVHASIVTLSSDEPLVSAQTTSLEKEHASFALSLAHEAELVISLRMLDTGTARDVSGVLRVTHGGNATGSLSDERELLYFVGGDGGVRVFERGQ